MRLQVPVGFIVGLPDAAEVGLAADAGGTRDHNQEERYQQPEPRDRKQMRGKDQQAKSEKHRDLHEPRNHRRGDDAEGRQSPVVVEQQSQQEYDAQAVGHD